MKAIHLRSVILVSPFLYGLSFGQENDELKRLDGELSRLVRLEDGGREEDTQATFELAFETAHRVRDFDRLRRWAELCLQRFPDHAGALLAHGMAQRQSGEYEGAEETLQRLLEQQDVAASTRHTGRHELALVFLKSGRPRDALRPLASLLAEDPDDRRAYLLLAQALARLGKREVAHAFVETSRELEVSDGEEERARDLEAVGKVALAARFRSRALAERGRYSEALAVFDRVDEERFPGVEVYRLERLLGVLDVPAARARVDSLRARWGQRHPDLLGWGAVATWMEGDGESAAEVLDSLCRERKRALDAWGPLLARIYLEDLEAFDVAGRVLGAYLHGRESVEASILLARVELARGAREDALVVLQAMPRTTKAWREHQGDVWLARCLLENGAPAEDVATALARVPPAGRRQPEYHEVVADSIGRGADRAGNREDTRLDGAESDDSAHRRARALHEAARAGELATRLHELERAACRAPGSAGAQPLREAAAIRRAMGDHHGAVRLARLALVRDPAAVATWKLLHELLARPGEVFLRLEVRRELVRLEGSGETSTATVEAMVEAIVEGWLRD